MASTPDIRPIHVFLLLPDFMQRELLKDDAFRDALAVETCASVSLAGGETEFDRGALYQALRALYREDADPPPLADQQGSAWTVTLLPEGAILMTSGEREYRLAGHDFLSPDGDRRLAHLRGALASHGFPPTALDRWRKILEERPLLDDEVERYEQDLQLSPIGFSRQIRQELNKGEGNKDTLAPEQRHYYEALIGECPAATLEAYVSDVFPGHVDAWLAWDRKFGARIILLLAAHSSIMTSPALATFDPDELLELAIWAADHGNLWSKIGMLELGLQQLAKAPLLEEPLARIAEELCALDPNDPKGRLQLAMALFIFVEGKLSRHQTLRGWPPFRRRLAAIAQAALIEREVYGQIDGDIFRRFLVQEGGRRFYLQTCIDTRTEPRWLPDYVAAEQLKHELMGRIRNAVTWHALPEGDLKERLTGEREDSAQNLLSFPASFFPGPLEGSEASGGADMPKEVEEQVLGRLKEGKLEPSAVIGLINLAGLFRLTADQVQQAIELIREAKHRLTNTDADGFRSIMTGLAAVAASTRNTELSAELRIIARKWRRENGATADFDVEFFVMLIAAAAHEEKPAWRQVIGEWASELAFEVQNREAARLLADTLADVCSIEPELRKSVGRAHAALLAYLGIG